MSAVIDFLVWHLGLGVCVFVVMFGAAFLGLQLVMCLVHGLEAYVEWVDASSKKSE